MGVIPNRVRVLVVVSALALAAGLLTLASLASPTQAQAEHIRVTTERVPYSEYLREPSTGEVFQVYGTILTVNHYTIDANGGVHAQYHVDTRGTGESLTTGAKYTSRTMHQGQVNYSVGDSFTYYTSYVMTFTRQGEATPDDDYKVTIYLKQTVNANGELTTQIEKFEFGSK
jgi:hypothetical protein